MRRSPSTVPALAALGLALISPVAATASAPELQARISVPQGTEGGLRFNVPTVQATAEGARIRGSVCRSTRLPFIVARQVRIELLDSKERVLEASTVRPSGSHAGRSPGCATYEARQDWKVERTETIRICLAAKGADRCVGDPGARS